MTFSINNIQHKRQAAQQHWMLSVIKLSVIHAECHLRSVVYAECCYAGCRMSRNDDWLYAEFRLC